MTPPCVAVDPNAKTTILARQGRKFYYVVPMQSGRLTVKKLTAQQVLNRRYKLIDVDIVYAVNMFLKHSGGLTKAAEAELKALLEG